VRVCVSMEGVGRRDRERKRRRKREKEKKVKTVSIKLKKSRDGSDCSFEIWKFNLILISVL
jgi:hypothetical protein